MCLAWVCRECFGSFCPPRVSTYWEHCSGIAVLHYMHSQGENMLLTQTFTLLLDCIHSSFGTIGWSEAVHRPILSDTFHIKPLAKDPTNKILPTKWHHGKLKHPLLERFLWPCWNSLCDLRISRLWHCEKFIQEFKGWGTNSQFQLALGLAWDQRSPPRCIPAKNVANNYPGIAAKHALK